MGCQGGLRSGAWDTARAVVTHEASISGCEPLVQWLKPPVLVQSACGKGHARGLQGSSTAQLALEGLTCGLGSLGTQAQPHETGVAHKMGSQEVKGLAAEQACRYSGFH